MNKEVDKTAPKGPDLIENKEKKISYKKAFYIRSFLTNALTEEILLRRFGYRRLEETPDRLYPDIKKSLFSLKARLFHDRRKWENNREAKGLDYKPEPIYDKNTRIF